MPVRPGPVVGSRADLRDAQALAAYASLDHRGGGTYMGATRLGRATSGGPATPTAATTAPRLSRTGTAKARPVSVVSAPWTAAQPSRRTLARHCWSTEVIWHRRDRIHR